MSGDKSVQAAAKPRPSETEIVEGGTRLLVPAGSMTETVPPRDLAFYNPRARTNRDLSIAAYAALLNGFDGPGIILESLSGVGARGLRAANEIPHAVEKVILNDINPDAIALARRSAGLNGIVNAEFSVDEACRFLISRSGRGRRGAITDVDPFGSPAPFFDCAIRSTMHGGMISCTATDLQVLNGLFDHACRNKYGGTPVRGTAFGNETAIRLVLGSLSTVAARLGASTMPLFVESEMHYYRIYVRVMVRHSTSEDIGYMTYCGGGGRRSGGVEDVHSAGRGNGPRGCGGRGLSVRPRQDCDVCGGQTSRAGPLWTGPLFDESFVREMEQAMPPNAGRASRMQIARAAAEAGIRSGPYYTLDEIASRAGASPPRLADAICRLRGAGFAAAPTSLSHTGLRTDAPIDRITEIIFSP